jgi:hypothetical protein
MRRKSFGFTMDWVAGEWRRLHNEDLLCSAILAKYSGDELKKNEMGGAYGTYGGERKCIRGFGEET